MFQSKTVSANLKQSARQGGVRPRTSARAGERAAVERGPAGGVRAPEGGWTRQRGAGWMRGVQHALCCFV